MSEHTFHPADSYVPNATLFQGSGSLEEASHELYKVVPEVNIVHLAITVLSVFVVFFGLFSGFVKERLYVGEAIIATGFGIAFSGYAAGIFAPRSWSAGHSFDDVTLELTRVVIALSVFAVGVELPKAYILRHWKSLTMLLGPIMFLGWMVSAALMYAIIPGLEFLPALVVAAGVTPTDPILASSVVGKGKFAQEHVPAHIRHILQAESGCNDGAAFPFLYIALFILMRGHHTIGHAIGYWFLLCLLYQIVLGCIMGAVVGVLARKLLKFSKRRELIDRESMVAMYVALALLVTGLTTLAGSDDLLAAFACGTAFAWDDWFTESIEESNFSSTVDLLANCAIFIYLGATMPFSSWQDEMLTLTVWRLVLLSAGILAFRRLPTIYALQWWIPDIKTKREALFAGHFGPMGVGAIFISTLAAAKLPTPTVPPENALDTLALVVQPITYFIVLSSILIHGLTISFFTLGRRVHSRVTSISRTFTTMSRDDTRQLEEPSWMSRVKRAQNREDIVINRDDDGEAVVEKEGTAAESGDIGRLAMFGAPTLGGDEPSTGSETAGSSEKDLEKGEVEGEIIDEEEDVSQERPSFANRRRRTQRAMERERDDNPPKNILAESENEEEHEERVHDHQPHHLKEEDGGVDTERPSSRVSDHAKEARYCKPGQTQTWQEGRKIIIDHNDGTDVEVIDLDASPEDARRANANPLQRVLTIPEHVIQREKSIIPQGDQTAQQHEESAIHRISQRFLKTGNMLGAAKAALHLKEKDEGLTQEQKEARKREKLKKDAWCRKEQKFRDTTDREWMEGSKVVTEHFDGTVEVRELTETEKRARAARHLAALKALGSPIDSVEAELAKLTKTTSKESIKGKEISRPFGRNSSPGDGEGPVASTSAAAAGGSAGGRGRSRGVALERTDRIEPPADEEEDGGDQAPPLRPLPASTTTSSAPRPSPPARSNSALQAVRHMFARSPSSTRSPESGRSPETSDTPQFTEEPEEDEELAQPTTIRFADVDRPSREGSTGTGRPLPVVGSGLSVRRTPTIPKKE